MLVNITDLVLNFTNGTNVSLFPTSRSSSISASLTPRLPRPNGECQAGPTSTTSRIQTDASIGGRSFGIDFFAVRYEHGKILYNSDLTIKLLNGWSVRASRMISWLSRACTAVEGQGSRSVNSTDPTLTINPIQQVNADDLSQIGRQLLSGAYLMVNEEMNQCTLWSANPTNDVDLVAFDASGEEATSICTPPSSTISTTSTEVPADGLSPPVAPSSSGALPTGVIIEIVVAIVAVILTGLGIWLCRRKRARKVQQAGQVETIVEEVPEVQQGQTFSKIELPDTSERWQRELDGQGPGPQPGQHYELYGCMPEHGRGNVF